MLSIIVLAIFYCSVYWAISVAVTPSDAGSTYGLVMSRLSSTTASSSNTPWEICLYIAREYDLSYLENSTGSSKVTFLPTVDVTVCCVIDWFSTSSITKAYWVNASGTS